jgi:hypothetical protein
MSRKFLNDGVQVLQFSAPSALAAGADTSYPAGHSLLNATDGTIYTNQGNYAASVWGNFPANRYELVETFQHLPQLNASIAVATNLDFEVLGTNAANAGITFADGGGIVSTTGTSSNDQVIVTPHLDTTQTAWAAAKWNTNDRVVFETTITTPATVTSYAFWAGLKLTNTSVVATDDDQCFVKCSTAVSSGAIQFVTSNAGTDTTTVTGLTLAASTKYHIKIKIDASRIARLYVNGDLVATSTAALKADIDLIPYIGVQTLTAAARALTVRGLKLSKDLND